jgi:hypothetical protein
MTRDSAAVLNSTINRPNVVKLLRWSQSHTNEVVTQGMQRPSLVVSMREPRGEEAHNGAKGEEGGREKKGERRKGRDKAIG